MYVKCVYYTYLVTKQYYGATMMCVKVRAAYTKNLCTCYAHYSLLKGSQCNKLHRGQVNIHLPIAVRKETLKS